MTSLEDVDQAELVPIACSLDAAGLVERRGEFAGLFGGLLVAQERLPRELRAHIWRRGRWGIGDA
jgi:hypothetical protein